MIGLQAQKVPVVSTVTKAVAPLTTSVQSMWNTIPASIRPFIIPVGLGAFGLFMTWAKMLWQKKALQTEIRATQQTGQLTGRLTEAQSIIDKREREIEVLSNTTDGGKLREVLLDNKDLTTQLQIKSNRIRDFETRIQALNKKIEDLRLDIKALQIRNDELTTVA